MLRILEHHPQKPCNCSHTYLSAKAPERPTRYLWLFVVFSVKGSELTGRCQCAGAPRSGHPSLPSTTIGYLRALSETIGNLRAFHWHSCDIINFDITSCGLFYHWTYWPFLLIHTFGIIWRAASCRTFCGNCLWCT